MKRMIFLAAAVVFFAACDDSEELTCEVLASPDFCWKVAVDEAYACTIDTMDDCIMSADGKTCTYDEGIEATFSPALDPEVSIIDFDSLAVTIKDAQGAQCAKFVDNDESGFELTTATGTVTVGGTSTYKVECQDATVYATDKPFDLLSCGDGGLFNSSLPGSFKSGSGQSFVLGPSPQPEGAFGLVSGRFPDTGTMP